MMEEIKMLAAILIAVATCAEILAVKTGNLKDPFGNKSLKLQNLNGFLPPSIELPRSPGFISPLLQQKNRNTPVDVEIQNFYSLQFLVHQIDIWRDLPIAIAFAGMAYLLWYFWYRPFDMFRDYTDFGYEGTFATQGATDKKTMINEFRRRKKLGNLPPPYPNGWFAILEGDQLPRKAVKEVNVLGLNLVAWRGESGACFVSDAYCPHLGAHLAVGGKVKKDCIQCPFHGWAFDGCSGALKDIPYSESVPAGTKLHMWPVLEMYGFVYIWHHAENLEPTWLPDTISELDSRKWRYRGRSEFRVTCHIQEIPENGPDAAHLNVVHKAHVLDGTKPDDNRFKWSWLEHVWSAKWTPNVAPREHEALLVVQHYMTLFNKFRFFNITVDIRQLGPGIVVMYFNTLFGNGVLIQNVTPAEPLLQRVTHRFYSALTFPHPLALAVLHGEATQISRDIVIWNRKTYLHRPVLVKEDKQIKVFRKWYSQFYSENSREFQLCGKDMLTF